MALSAAFGADRSLEKFTPDGLLPKPDLFPMPTNKRSADIDFLVKMRGDYAVDEFAPRVTTGAQRSLLASFESDAPPSGSSDPTNVESIPRHLTTPTNDQRSNPRFQFLHGTTTLSFIYSGGVIVAVDSRASGGTAIFSYSVNKMIPISQYLCGTMAGGAADCTYWMRVLSLQVRMYEMRNRERITVAAASKMLVNLLYQYKAYGISVGSMVAGYDKHGPGLYLVTNEGLRAKGNIFSVGSGSPYALGVLDNYYRFQMSDTEAYHLARRAIFEAGRRDIASGGFVSVYRIKPTGWSKMSTQDISELYFKAGKENKLESLGTDA